MNPMINNTAILSGKLMHDFREYHTTLGEKFFAFTLFVKRNSGENDILPIVISEKLLSNKIKEIEFVKLTGQIRTFNKENGKVEIYFFAKDIEELQEEKYFNEVKLRGFLCKKGKYRTTFTDRKVIDFIIAVNRLFRKSDYLPVLAWGKDAKYIENQEISTEIQITGRFQSRKYLKKNDDGSKYEKIAYEISSSQISIVTAVPDIEEKSIY